MPIPLAAYPLITAGVNAAGQGINAAFQGATNAKARQYNTWMYDKQRKDSLADWDMMNAYNSPEAQMQRFKAAGLNPNLIYGQTNEASPVRSSSAGNWSPTAPRIDPGQITGAYFDTRLKNQQMQLLEADKEIKDVTVLKILADIANTTNRTQRGEVALGIERETRDQVARMITDKMFNIQSQYRLNTLKADMIEMTANSTVAEATWKVLNQMAQHARTEKDTERITQAIENMKKTGAIQDFEIMLNKSGTTKGDETWLRALLVWLNKFGLSIDDIPTTPATSTPAK